MGDLIFVCGGYPEKFIANCWTANILGGNWTEIASMKTTRAWHTLTAVGDKLIATGGSDDFQFGTAWSAQDGISSVEVYTQTSGNWEQASWSLPHNDLGHCVLSFSSVDEIIYISGAKTVNAVEVKKINVNTGESTDLATPDGGLGGHHYCVQHSDMVYMTEEESGKAWKYSITQNSWTKLADVLDENPQGLAVVAGELTFFGSSGVKILRNGAWVNSNVQPVGRMGEWSYEYPAIVVLP